MRVVGFDQNEIQKWSLIKNVPSYEYSHSLPYLQLYNYVFLLPGLSEFAANRLHYVTDQALSGQGSHAQCLIHVLRYIEYKKKTQCCLFLGRCLCIRKLWMFVSFYLNLSS